MDLQSFGASLSRDLADRAAAHTLRQRRVIRAIDSTHAEINGRRCVNFASNNYLGLTHHPRMIEALRESIARHGAGSGAAGLITGYTDAHAAAESEIAKLKGCESAVLLPSGYQANLAAIQTLASFRATDDSTKAGGLQSPGLGVRFLLDKLSHASLIDAVRATGSDFRVFPHNHIGKLDRLLAESETDQLQVVVTESIFSMDGDAADLAGIAELKKRFPFVLLVDEAHATGVYGHAGAGLIAELGLSHAVDISIITLSKALGCVGGAVCARRVFCESLVNHGRAYIYATSVPPFVADAACAAIAILRDEPQRQRRLREIAKDVREQLSTRFEIPPGDSPIIPLILREEKAALSAAGVLQENGLLVVAVRPPTVPRGTSRLRVTVSCDHTDEEIEQLLKCLNRLNIV